jgi:hypothetical protein
MSVRLRLLRITLARLILSTCIPSSVLYALLPVVDISVHAQETAPVPAPATPKPPGPFESGFKTPAILPSVDGITVEDLMLEKGLITMDDYLRLKAEAERRANESAIVAEYTASPRWYERLRHYGYGMFRYNQLGNPNGQVRTYHDASVGDVANGAQPGFFYRRIRWVVTGQVSDRVGIFIQPDLCQ